MTTRGEELGKQRHWRLRPAYASLKAFDELLENEFLSPAEQQAYLCRSLEAVVGFAAVHTPYYASLFARIGLDADRIRDIEGLAALPVLSKQDVLDHQDDLRSRALPAGETIAGSSASSGTTGRPVTVVHSQSSSAMFFFLRQRHCRWHGMDPMRLRVDIRSRRDVGRHADGSANADGVVVQLPSWRGLGRYFETGLEYAFNVSNPIEQQVEWIKRLGPQYAMSYPTVFEEWLLANEGRPPVDSLEVLVGVGSQLTPSMRRRLEASYGVPIHQSYGLNEIGLVACRCESGRYHTHSEHCLVEVVDADGQPCLPGQTGRVLVTTLRNLAMPLIRYDTGDLAEAVARPCPCGRTLPSFGEIAGRFRRYAGLPSGTKERFRAICRVFETYPHDGLIFLRRYQVHQDRQNRFTLRMRTVSPIPDAFREAVLEAWKPVAGIPPSALAIVEVPEIACSPSGKLLDFDSDFSTDAAVTKTPLE